VLTNTLNLLRTAGKDFGMVVNTPIIFTPGYSELNKPVGILKAITELGAFQSDTFGAEIIPELSEFDDFVQVIKGKRGLNAFVHTDLLPRLKEAGITEVVFAGTVTSLCIDSSARSALDSGFKVTILSDCTSSRTVYEQDFYCQEIFPLYAKVTSALDLMAT
tara:strand:+ start:264 stop:749 length:486 start_codon:yes stop_codon:yes gene_type:complete